MVAVKMIELIDVSVVTDLFDFISLEDEWNSLVESTKSEPFYRHEFIYNWIESFAQDTNLRILIGRDRRSHLKAVLPLMARQGSFYGLPVRELSSIANTHSCRFDIIAEDGREAGRAFFSFLNKNRDWDMIKITDVPESGNGWYLQEYAGQFGYPTGTWESQMPPFIHLPEKYDQIYKGLKSKFKENLRRRRRKLENIGRVSLERITGGEQLDSALKEAFAIEQMSWKGKSGTAIVQDRQTHDFYTAMAYTAADRNYLSLYFLNLNDRPIAFQYGFTYNGVYYSLKAGYNEDYKELSPGHILTEEILIDSISRGLKRFDFLGSIYGPHMDWKRNWSNKTLSHSYLFVFRNNSYGRALCKAKFNWIPTAKKLLRILGR